MRPPSTGWTVEAFREQLASVTCWLRERALCVSEDVVMNGVHSAAVPGSPRCCQMRICSAEKLAFGSTAAWNAFPTANVTDEQPSGGSLLDGHYALPGEQPCTRVATKFTGRRKETAQRDCSFRDESPSAAGR